LPFSTNLILNDVFVVLSRMIPGREVVTAGMADAAYEAEEEPGR
jgi:hypothetical protein